MERIFEAADQTSRLLFEDGLKNMDFSWIFSRGGTAAFVVTGVIALLMILFGAKCKYVLFATQGFLLGVTAGLTASWFLHLEGWVMIGVSAGAGLVLAAFEAVFRKFGAFVFSLIAVFVSVAALGGGEGYLVLGIAGGVALIFAILAAVFGDPLIIPVMGISGGVLGGIVAYHYLPYESRIVFYAVSAVLAVVGICIQYAMKSSKIARLERKKAKEIREKKSVESEIEMARNVLDSDEQEESDN